MSEINIPLAYTSKRFPQIDFWRLVLQSKVASTAHIEVLRACRLLAYSHHVHVSDNEVHPDFLLSPMFLAPISILLLAATSLASKYNRKSHKMGGNFSRTILLFIHLSSLARAVSAQLVLPTTVPTLYDLNITLTNSTLDAVIPNTFTIRPSTPLPEPTLDRRYTLLLTLHVLGSLALEDFDSQQQSQTWRSLQEVSIDIVGPRMTVDSPLAMRKYAIWGIYKAVHLMTATNDLRPRNYELFYGRFLVGYVSFNNGTPGGRGTSLSVQLDALPKNATTVDLGTHINFSFDVHGRSIGVDNVFMTLFTAILKAAPYPKSQRVLEFVVRSRPFSTYLSFMGQDEPEPGAPVCAYEQVIQMFTQLPLWMMAHDDQWLETDMVLSIDDYIVGAGVLKWQDPEDVGGVMTS